MERKGQRTYSVWMEERGKKHNVKRTYNKNNELLYFHHMQQHINSMQHTIQMGVNKKQTHICSKIGVHENQNKTT